MKPLRAAVAAVVLPLLALIGPAPSAQAVAAVRWASPSGTGTACTEAAPCDLDTAVEAPEVNAGDEVIVKPGSYGVVQLEVLKAIQLHGQPGQPAPTITTTGVFGVLITAAATVSDLQFVAAGVSPGISVLLGGATLERISSRTVTPGSVACTLAAPVVLRDSVCWATGTNSRGLGGNLNVFVGTQTVTLRNVTAIGEDNGIGYSVQGAGAVLQVDAGNVIASATGVGGIDVRALATTGGSAQVTLAHSNYATTDAVVGAGGGSSTVTLPGTGTNQTTAPLFVNAASGDFHQAPGSPTIDAGELDAFTGATDLDGDPRAIRVTSCPALPDIGADELTSALECDPPETTISGPSGATDDSTPTFQLGSDEPGSTFECRLDSAAFAPCTSPYTTPVLALGTHTVAARATDLSGNVDPTPATRGVNITAPQGTPATPPDTTLTQAPKKKVTTSKRKARVSFAFTSSTGGTFECSLDGAAFAACTSPVKARLRKGKHVFAVRAVNVSGLVDPTPATVTFKVKVRPRSS